MVKIEQFPNRVKPRRLERSWSQATLAERAGISRAAVSAVEVHRLVPSVAAALALAKALDCSVEDLFGAGRIEAATKPRWAWSPPQEPCRFWQAMIGGQTVLYPVETTPAGVLEHDGVCQSGTLHTTGRFTPEKTLVIACCDPAASLLAEEIKRLTSLRVIVLSRSSRQALALLSQGLVHVAGLHLSTRELPDANRLAVRERLGEGSCRLLRVARWQEGVALSPGSGVRSVRSAVRSRLRWVGREHGSGARQCLDELLGQRPQPRHLARDHRGVAEAIRAGWADAGVCVRLVSEEAGLRFIPVQEEIYELCFSIVYEDDPRIKALREALRLMSYRRLLADLPGYDAVECGEMQTVS